MLIAALAISTVAVYATLLYFARLDARYEHQPSRDA